MVIEKLEDILYTKNVEQFDSFWRYQEDLKTLSFVIKLKIIVKIVYQEGFVRACFCEITIWYISSFRGSQIKIGGLGRRKIDQGQFKSKKIINI